MKLFNYQYRKCVGEQPLLLFELPKTKKLCQDRKEVKSPF